MSDPKKFYKILVNCAHLFSGTALEGVEHTYLCMVEYSMIRLGKSFDFLFKL